VFGAALGAWSVGGAAACALVLPELVLGLSEPVAVPLDGVCGFGEVLLPGENGVDAPAEGVEGPPEHAETAAEASIVMVPQPTKVNIALSPVPAMAARTFMSPPRAFRQAAGPVSRSQRQKQASEGNTRDNPAAARVCRQWPESAGVRKGNAHGRHRHAMI
jgi:hypothetical protein